jgi:hypothetical protein
MTFSIGFGGTSTTEKAFGPKKQGKGWASQEERGKVTFDGLQELSYR